MAKTSRKKKTTVGAIDADVLAYTAGEDVILDGNLVQQDCIGSAAHVTMLSRMKVTPRIFSAAEAQRVVKELVVIMRASAKGKFKISLADQDVHLAVERALTRKLGDLGKKFTPHGAGTTR